MYTGEITEEFKEMFKKYYDTFGEYFPTMSYENDDIIEFMARCIRRNKPYKPKYKKDEDS